MTEIAGKLFTWINTRLPIVNTFERHLSKHPVPSKVNFWYLFGALAAVTLIIQVVTGIWLIMPYSNTEEQAFSSIEYIGVKVNSIYFPLFLIKVRGANGARSLKAILPSQTLLSQLLKLSNWGI